MIIAGPAVGLSPFRRGAMRGGALIIRAHFAAGGAGRPPPHGFAPVDRDKPRAFRRWLLQIAEYWPEMVPRDLNSSRDASAGTRALQSDLGVPVDGDWGPITHAALETALDMPLPDAADPRWGGRRAAPAPSVPSTPSTPVDIVVSHGPGGITPGRDGGWGAGGGAGGAGAGGGVALGWKIAGGVVLAAGAAVTAVLLARRARAGRL